MSMDPLWTPAGRRLPRCGACRRSDEVSHADLMRFTRQGWPKCCGQTMGYAVDASPAGPTPPGSPALPAGPRARPG